jgi:hypothetical protein
MSSILLILLLSVSSFSSLIVAIRQFFELLHQHSLILIMTIINNFIDLLLHSLTLFFHALFHLLNARVILVYFFHLLKSLKVFNLTH